MGSTFYFPLSTFHFPLSTFHFPLSTFYFLLSTFYFLLSTFHFLLSTFYFLLSTFYFPLSVRFSFYLDLFPSDTIGFSFLVDFLFAGHHLQFSSLFFFVGHPSIFPFVIYCRTPSVL